MSDEFNDKRENEEPGELGEEKPAKASQQPKAVKKAEPNKAAPKKPRKKNRIARWFREMKSELKKVIWPTPKQTANNTAVALAVMVASGIVIWFVDFVGSQIFEMLLTIGS